MFSMTGYGNARVRGEDFSIAVEIQTYNHRFLDIRVYLPPEYQSLEKSIVRKIGSAVNRGRVNVRVNFQRPRDRYTVSVNRPLAKKYWSALGRMKKAVGASGEISPEVLVTLPGVLETSPKFPSKKDFRAGLRQALEKALEKAQRMRQTEGRKLSRDLKRHLAQLNKGLKRVSKIIDDKKNASPPAKSTGRAGRKKNKTAESGEGSGINVEEELSRLRCHLEEFDKIIEKDEPVGKVLEFICLEILREVTTLGDKIGDARISREIVFMKNEIESLREQLRNIE